jgi:non-specific serine/threonine protein kinase
LARTLDDPWSLAWPLQGLGFAACAQGDLERARASLAETEPLWRQAGELYGMAWTHEGLGHVALAEGRYSEAAERFKNALTMRQELSDLPGIADCLDGIGGVLVRRGRQEDGVRLAAAAEALRETLPLALGPLRRNLRERWLAPIRARLGEAAIAALWNNGRCIAVEDATAFALSALEPALIEDSTAGVLTRRELAVAALVASGMSNRQIAERLIIAERTAATHIEHILAKLDFTSRTQIGIWAVEHGLKDSSQAVHLTPNG